MTLHTILETPAVERASHPAVIEGNGTGQIDYARLCLLSDRVRDRLVASGIEVGDRVGVYLRKSCDVVAAIFGILKAGAAYVPVDPTAPASRNVYIHDNCRVKVVIVERRFEAGYREEYAKLGSLMPGLIVLEAVGGGGYLERTLEALDKETSAPAVPTRYPPPDELAYILYTSGSTGKPKGVMLSHRNASSFVNWCSEAFQPRPSDVFSSHAPLHFDLSILDLYVPIKHGASLVLIDERLGKDPVSLSKLIGEYRITVWYSAPSILALLAQFGRIGEYDYSNLRTVLFAGEVFPIAQLRLLKQQLPRPRYFNLYGPTETNVCTYYEIPVSIPDDRVDPYPIGVVCKHLEGEVVDEAGQIVRQGVEGELCIAGPNVMVGYWGLPEQTARSFRPGDGSGARWYKTGDIVVEQPDGNYRYVGRRDRMVKKRGYRVELGEIEACLYRHAALREAAVVAIPDSSGAVCVKAHLSVRGPRPSVIELKTFCSQHLPLYMVPDIFAFHDVLPKTSTDKIDHQALIALG